MVGRIRELAEARAHLARGAHLLVAGPAGMGKRTFLRALWEGREGAYWGCPTGT